MHIDKCILLVRDMLRRKQLENRVVITLDDKLSDAIATITDVAEFVASDEVPATDWKYPYNILAQILDKEDKEYMLLIAEGQFEDLLYIIEGNERNVEIFINRYSLGMNTRELGEKYNLSRSRIQEITERIFRKLLSTECKEYFKNLIKN